MLRIAVCDDDLQELSRISRLLKEYQEEKDTALHLDTYSGAIELLETMKSGDYDILLLDVLMPGINGMQTAHEIRGFDRDIKIIFLTSSPEFAVESYAVDAYYYLLKPATQVRLFPILDKLLSEASRSQEALSIKLSSGMIRILFNRLEYLEIMSKKLYFHLVDGSVKEVYGSLSEYEKTLLDRKEFIKTHRSYIVNMEWIQTMTPGMLTTSSGKSLPISRLLYTEVREAYMNHLFAEKGIE